MPAMFLHCESEATMSRAYSKVYNDKSRHISLWHEYIWELISSRFMTIVYVKSGNNLGDPLTKEVSRDMVRKTSSGMGLKPILKGIDNGKPTL